jgi:o-succinylbenzoate---CoA ligase
MSELPVRLERKGAQLLAPEEASLVLTNPRTSEVERLRIHVALGNLECPASRGHFWVSTSGSTAAPGASKWVALSMEAILASAQAVNQHLESNEKDIWLHVLPEFHVGGIGILARARLSGATVLDGLSESRWLASDFYRLCMDERATLSALVPAQIHDLVEAGFRAPSSMRAIVVGGAALSPSLYARARALGWPLLPSYGLSELASQAATAPLTSVTSLADEAFEMPELELLSHVEAKVADDGRISLRSEALFSGYGLIEGQVARWHDPKREGWFQSEDRAELHATGERLTLKVLGRTADFLKIGGESVDLARLGAMLTTLIDDLASGKSRYDAALVPLPDTRLGHIIHLALHSEGDADGRLGREIFERFNKQVLPFERARGLTRLPAPLPRSPLGKVLRAELIEALLSRDV